MKHETILPTLSIGERQAVLQREIQRLLAMGPRRSTGHGRWRLVTQTETTAQLVQPKTFSAPIAFLWFLVLGIGLIFYVIYYAGKKDRHLYVSVDEAGNVQKNLS